MLVEAATLALERGISNVAADAFYTLYLRVVGGQQCSAPGCLLLDLQKWSPSQRNSHTHLRRVL